MKPTFVLKNEAKEIIRTSRPKMLYVAAVYLALCFTLSMLSANLLNSRISYSDMAYFTQALEDGDLEQAMSAAAEINPPAAMQLIDMMIRLVTQIVSVGFLIFVVQSVRRLQPCFGNLLDGFGMPFRILALYILTYLFIMLWSLLFFIPGIIAAYRYRFATFLLIDHPEYTPMQCLQESKRLTYGHKWDLFCLDMSFLGWHILRVIPYLGWIVNLWVTPYYNVSCFLFYEQCSPEPFTYSQDTM